MMLHRIKSHNCESKFCAILMFQREVLIFTCRDDTSTEPTLADLKQFFGDDTANWLATLLWVQRGANQGNTKPLYDTLTQLIKYMQDSPKNTREEILNAFDNDISFHEHQDDVTFHFLFNTLHEDTQKALRPLMEKFYTDILDNGFKSILANRFGRDTFTTAFWSENAIMCICPACDTLKPEENRQTGKVYAQVDHFFPKSDYPFLSVHPYNLVPICNVCNERYKRDKDPIDNHLEAPLLRTFLPYLRPAWESEENSDENQIKVEIYRDKQGATYQVIVEGNSREFSDRVANLENLFKLSDRWLTRLRPQVINRIAERVVEWGGMLQTLKQPREKEFLKQQLARLQLTCQGKVGQEQDQILWASYLQSCVFEDEEEFEALFAVFSQKSKN